MGRGESGVKSRDELTKAPAKSCFAGGLPVEGVSQCSSTRGGHPPEVRLCRGPDELTFGSRGGGIGRYPGDDITRRSFLDRSAALGGGLLAALLGAGCDGKSEDAPASTCPDGPTGGPDSGCACGATDAGYLPCPVVDVHCHVNPAKMIDTQPQQTIYGLIKRCTDSEVNADGDMVSTIDGISSIVYAEVEDEEGFFATCGGSGITRSLLSFSMELEIACNCLTQSGPMTEAAVTRMFNDTMRSLVENHPLQAVCMAMVNPFNVECVHELKRCASDLGTKGISIGSSWNGRYLDEAGLVDFYTYAENSGQPIFLHPPFVPPCGKMDAYKLEETLGRPVDCAMTVLRMIMSGLFDRHPDLKVILPHMGGALPGIIYRADFGYDLEYTGLPEGAKCKQKPSYYLKNLYADCMGFSASGVRHAIEVFGPEHVLFGSDYAPVPIEPIKHVDLVRGLGLGQGDLEKVFWRNANGLFNLGLEG